MGAGATGPFLRSAGRPRCAWAWAGPWGRSCAARGGSSSAALGRRRASSTQRRRRPLHGPSCGPAASQSPGYFAIAATVAEGDRICHALVHAWRSLTIRLPVMDDGSMASDDAAAWPGARPSPAAGDAGAGGPGLLRRQPVGGGGRRRHRDRLDPVTSGRPVHRRPAVRRRSGFRRGAGQPAGGDSGGCGCPGRWTTPVDAEWVFDPGRRPRTWSVAQACGLALLGGPPTPETALAAHSRGVGQLIAEALRAGARRIVVGLGGSACTDGGQGMIAELGGLDAARRQLADVELIAASDVRISAAGAVGRGQGVRAAEGCGHGHRRGARSPPRGVGAGTGRGGRAGRQRRAGRGRRRRYRRRAAGAGRPVRVRRGDHRRAHPFGRRPCRRGADRHR